MFNPFFEDELQKLVLLAQLAPPPPPPQEQPSAEPEPSTSSKSAFEPFLEGSRRFRKGSSSSSSSMSKRMIEFMKKDWSKKTEIKEPERQRSTKHMMNERMRRERERQSFLDLHSALPSGIRNEKISIIQTAATEIRRLERRKQELTRKNSTMAETLAREGQGKEGEGGGDERTARIRVRVENPTAGIDSLQEVLKCLKHMGLSAKSIGFELSKQELTAVIEIEISNEINAAEVEAVVSRTLYESDTWHAREHSLHYG